MAQIIKRASELFNAIQNAEYGSTEYDALVAKFTMLENDVLSKYENGKFTYDEMLDFYGIQG